MQPLDVGCIQTAKALFRKRHMCWVLDQLRSTPAGKTPNVKCDVRQAMEWFVAALHQVPAEAIRNCWLATKILSPSQTLELRDLSSGVRHNGRPAHNESRSNPSACVPDDLLQELSGLLSELSFKLASSPDASVPMCDVMDTLDLPIERQVFDPPHMNSVEDDDEADGEEDDDAAEPRQRALLDIDIDEQEPERVMTIADAKIAAAKLFAFVSENGAAFNRIVGTKTRTTNGVLLMDAIREGVDRMVVTTQTRQATLGELFRSSGP